MPAEEFATGVLSGPGSKFSPTSTAGCGCESDCPGDECRHEHECCRQQMICCCHPAPCPAPKPPEVDEGCCCKQSFRAALSLLCDQQISSLLDFDSAAFITRSYTAGAAAACGKPKGGPHGRSCEDGDEPRKPTPPPPPCPCEGSDNLGELTGSFRRFALCSCDLLDIDAKLFNAAGKCCDFTATQVSLCELDAVVIQGAAACPEGDLTASEVTARNFRCLRRLLAQRLSPCGSPCGENWCACSCACDGRDCCCAAGLLDTLARNNLSRRVSLVAGLLVLRNVMLLGTVGNVLVLANDCDNRLYFVCVNSVQFIG